MNVSFCAFDPALASGRYRMVYPAHALAGMGVGTGQDVVVVGKNGWTVAEVRGQGYRRVVFDCCDDHFDSPEPDLQAHYRNACADADAVTCNSRAMQARIRAATGRTAWVIPDPYEQPERAPRIHDRILWFGHEGNIKSLHRVVDSLLPRKVRACTNFAVPNPTIDPRRMPYTVVEWSQQAQDEEMEAAGICIIPTDPAKPCKSANRAIESIRRGIFPVCGPDVAAYSELGTWIGSIANGVDWALAHPQEVLDRIAAMQRYVALEFSPTMIGRMWLTALRSVHEA